MIHALAAIGLVIGLLLYFPACVVAGLAGMIYDRFKRWRE